MATPHTRLSQAPQLDAEHKRRAEWMKLKRAREMKKVLKRAEIRARIPKPIAEVGYSSQEDMKTCPSKPEISGKTQFPFTSASQTPNYSMPCQGGPLPNPGREGVPTPTNQQPMHPILVPHHVVINGYPQTVMICIHDTAVIDALPSRMSYPLPSPSSYAPQPPVQFNQQRQAHQVTVDQTPGVYAPPKPRRSAPSSHKLNNHHMRPDLDAKCEDIPHIEREDKEEFHRLINVESAKNRECVLCLVAFNSAIMEKSHLQGKRHNGLVDRAMYNAASSAKGTDLSVSNALVWKIDCIMRQFRDHKKAKKSLYGRCDLCGVDYPTDAQRKSHLKGKRHQENVWLQRAGKQPRKHKAKDNYHARFNRLDPTIQCNVEKGMRDRNALNAKKKKGSGSWD